MRTLDMSPASLHETAMAFWTPANLSLITRGSWLVPPADRASPVARLSTDSRTVETGQAYLALRGERFDGHDFVGPAFERGAALAIVEHEAEAPTDGAVLRVDDTLAALHAIAAAYRDLLAAAGCTVIAVAGSNGKTSTRSLIHGILDGRMIAAPPADPFAAAQDAPGSERPDQWRMTRLTGTQSPKSFNNHIGVPLTLLNASVADRFLVCEIGTNHPGETAPLAELVRPDAAVITSVGREHLEFFHDVEQVAQEHAALLEHVRPGGAIIVEHDAWQRVEPFARLPLNHTLLTYGDSPHGVAQLLDVQTGRDGVTFDVRFGDEPEPRRGLSLPLLGRHNAVNALAGVCLARWIGVDPIQLNLGLLNVAGVEGRLELRHFGEEVDVIHDAYNANPDSMHRALDVLRDLPAVRRVAVLGDMFELGELGPDAHREIGERLAGMKDEVGLAVLIGPLAMFIAQPLAKAWPADRVHVMGAWSDELPDQVAALLRPADVVLLKASRGMALERVIPAIEARFGARD